jgi:hypothetical protein
MPLQRSAQLFDLMGMVAAERAGLSDGQTHQLLYSDRGQMLLIMVLRELPKRASAPLRLLADQVLLRSSVATTTGHSALTVPPRDS